MHSDGRLDNSFVSLEDIKKGSVAINEFQFPGVYFLLKDNEVVYVGQSGNVFSRCSSHVSCKDFDSISWIPCIKSELNNLEADFIVKIKPKLNASMPSNDKYWPTSKLLKTIKDNYGIKLSLEDLRRSIQILNIEPCIQLQQSAFMHGPSITTNYYVAKEVLLAFESRFLPAIYQVPFSEICNEWETQNV